jgi:hypothetical protein
VVAVGVVEDPAEDSLGAVEGAGGMDGADGGVAGDEVAVEEVGAVSLITSLAGSFGAGRSGSRMKGK